MVDWSSIDSRIAALGTDVGKLTPAVEAAAQQAAVMTKHAADLMENAAAVGRLPDRTLAMLKAQEARLARRARGWRWRLRGRRFRWWLGLPVRWFLRLFRG